eukprot:CAMPEP_0197387348 /NCGR_PEP_ID=MMETSP1165-20131217/463_1 /TAXON_ID=284809 /ORGANISM="Chrysocystis fragilis, Strain CCMP3189" /LENGTH=978 /DNA_ID=CAMNT_0042912665 /DNA_START=93 /DNA_END=3026 /DNA_ORIENTATION=+
MFGWWVSESSSSSLPSTPSHLLSLHASYRESLSSEGEEAAVRQLASEVREVYSADDEGVGARGVEDPRAVAAAPSAAAASSCRAEGEGPRRAYLADGSWRELSVSGSASGLELVVAACGLFGVSEEATRYVGAHVVVGGAVRFGSVEPEARVSSAWASGLAGGWSAAATPRLGAEAEGVCLLVRLWTPSLRRAVTSAAAEDAGLTRLAYAHARACVMAEAWRCPLDDAALVAAVQLSATVSSGSAKVVRERLGEVLPASARATRGRDWELDVLVELGFRLNDPHASPQADLLAVVETWDDFGRVALPGTTVSRPAARRGASPALSHDALVLVSLVSPRSAGAGRPREVGFKLRECARWAVAPCGEVLEVECLATDERLALRGPPDVVRDACRRLDDYAALDWVEDPPQHHYVRPPPPVAPDASYLATLYDSLVAAVVRPPRSVYDVRRLGPTSFELGGTRFHRVDLALANVFGERLACSHWVPARYGGRDGPAKLPCVVFVHANSAARVQALHYCRLVLALGATFFAFDCAGSGLSDGDTVSLGWREARDLDVVARYLRRLGTVSSLAAWGCSMGAASIIFYLAGAGHDGPQPAVTACLDPPSKGASSLSRRPPPQNTAPPTPGSDPVPPEPRDARHHPAASSRALQRPGRRPPQHTLPSDDDSRTGPDDHPRSHRRGPLDRHPVSSRDAETAPRPPADAARGPDVLARPLDRAALRRPTSPDEPDTPRDDDREHGADPPSKLAQPPPAASRRPVEALDAVVLDSPYADLRRLAVDLAATRLVGGFSAPWLVATAVLHFLQRTIRHRADLDIDTLRPLDHVKHCDAPALFLHADQDHLVKLDHVEDLVKNYAGPRVLAIVDGSHSSPRSHRTLAFVADFLAKHARLTPPSPSPPFADNSTLDRDADAPPGLGPAAHPGPPEPPEPPVDRLSTHHDPRAPPLPKHCTRGRAAPPNPSASLTAAHRDPPRHRPTSPHVSP